MRSYLMTSLASAVCFAAAKDAGAAPARVETATSAAALATGMDAAKPADVIEAVQTPGDVSFDPPAGYEPEETDDEIAARVGFTRREAEDCHYDLVRLDVELRRHGMSVRDLLAKTAQNIAGIVIEPVVAVVTEG